MAAAPQFAPKGAQRFKTHSVGRQAGEVARLRVLQGPDHGAVYVITASQVTLGRGDENDIVLSDLKSSRRHAELILTPQGWVARDLGSANGITHNREATRQCALKNGESLGLGETFLEFLTSDQATRMLTLAPKSVAQIQSEEDALNQARARVRALGNSAPVGVPNGGLGGVRQDPQKLAIVIGALVVGGWLYYQSPSGGGGKAQKARPAPAVAPRDLTSYLPSGSAQDVVTERTIEMFFREGMREYRERNYLRARAQFESILQIRPSHDLAKRYLANANQGIQDEVKLQLERGKKNLDAGKLRSARGNFEAALRLLARDQSNERYKEAEDQLKKVNDTIRSTRLPSVSDEEGGTP